MSTTAPRIYLIDGSSYIYRAYYAIRHLSNSKGVATNAIFGFTKMLLKVVREDQPDLLAVVFDAKGPTFRTEIYPKYKANRAAMPDDLVPQVPVIKEVVRAFDIPALEEPGYEADDIIATLTRRLRREGLEVVIVSGDKDLTQLLEPGVRIFNLAKDDWVDHERVPAVMGVRPDQVRDYLALCGDASDNIPGVRGVGPKAACALLDAFGDLDAVFADLDRVAELPVRGAKGLQKKLAEGRESALLSRQLVRLETEAPCAFTAADLAYAGADSAPLEAFAEQWGLGRVAVRVPRRAG